MSRALRLFLALEVPEAHRREIGRRAAALRRSLPAARWVPAENLHLTLRFLGATDPDRVPRLVDAVRPVFAAFEPLTLRLAGGGTFPPARPARVAWVGIEGGERLHELQGEVAAAADATLGLEPEGRPFHPHVTLARPRRPWNRRVSEEFARAFEGSLGEPFVVRSGVLLESRLGSAGAVYTTVEELTVGGAP